jgi:hypothetical protein
MLASTHWGHGSMRRSQKPRGMRAVGRPESESDRCRAVIGTDKSTVRLRNSGGGVPASHVSSVAVVPAPTTASAESTSERLVVSSPSVCEVWAHRLLRQFSEPACVQACGDNRASDHCHLRAGRGLVLRLREAWDDQGCGVASATFASGGSTITWVGRESSSQLGIAAALAGVESIFYEWERDSGHRICNEHDFERSHQ